MLFNSYIFIFIFLPIALLGFHFIGKKFHHRVSVSWLVLVSLFFYGWWNFVYLGLIIISIAFNYVVGLSLRRKASKFLLVFGVVANLGLIGYFKYAGFFVEMASFVISKNFSIERVALPLAISFFTFQQITYLFDAHKGLTKTHDFLHYCLFVTFFPQLIAGPIVHHKELLPQFSTDIYKLKASHLAIGFSIFTLGLFKKVVLADSVAIYALPVFLAAENNVVLTLFEAWAGALAYTFQLYFDFSGYSDMAIGLARMFGIVLPLNFYSPYKANNIIEFWRRWHITLSRFLRDYLYIPLGGNRKGRIRRHVNLMVTMLLGGLWHGGGWTFIIWGGMHGLFLSINHGWNYYSKKLFGARGGMPCFIARFITFFAVVIAWVMFRAESVDGALNMYVGMSGYNGVSFHTLFHKEVFPKPKEGVLLLSAMFLLTMYAPNSIEFFINERPVLSKNSLLVTKKSKLVWKPCILYGFIGAIIFVISVLSIPSGGEFLYFNF